jgi:hypothetical protein
MTIGIAFAVYELTMWAAYIKGKKLGISAEKQRQRSSLGNATVLAVVMSIIFGSSLSINKVSTSPVGSRRDE